jgi:hypothetical protein
MNIKATSTLAALDRNQKGHLTQSDLKAAVYSMRLMRKLVVLLSILVLIFVACTFGAMYVAIMLTREIYVKGGRLADHNGNALSTLAQHDTILGLSFIPGEDTRRLQAEANSTSQEPTGSPTAAPTLSPTETPTEVPTEAPTGSPTGALTSSDGYTTMQIAKSYVTSTIESYRAGQVDWVVPLPDGTTRTVLIQGIDEDGIIQAWGRCESCESNYKWTVKCEESSNSEQCPITSTPEPATTQRRLLSARAKVKNARKGSSEIEGRMDRVLEGKQCF